MHRRVLWVLLAVGCDEWATSSGSTCPDATGQTALATTSQSYDAGLAGEDAAINSTHARLFLTRDSWETHLAGADDPVPEFDFETGDLILLDLPWVGCNTGGWQIDDVYVDSDAIVHVNAVTTEPLDPACDAFGWSGFIVLTDETGARDVAVCTASP